ncbi:MAG: NAD-glutamate dehydrogenase domain-containing protein, partial [Brooklawnia sp.]
EDDLLIITKDSERARVRRSAHMDYLGVHLRGDQDRHIERRFIGLFASSALNEVVMRVPILRGKALQITEAIGYETNSHGGRSVAAAIQAHPREELLQASVAELIPVIAEVADLEDPRQVFTYLRRGAHGRFLTVLVYFPRERYNTTVRHGITHLLNEVTGAESLQWSAQVTESPLARLYFTLKMPNGVPIPELDNHRLRRAIEEVTRHWDDRFLEIAERMDSAQRGVEWSDGYKEVYTPIEAVNDLVSLNLVEGPDDMAQIMYAPSPPENGVDFRLKMLRVGSEMVLSQIMPHLASLGVDVVDERPFELELRGARAHVYDFGLRLPGGIERLDGWSYEARARFTSAIAASYAGLGEADELNRLVTDSTLSWQQVSMLRAISRYLRQLGTTYSQPYIAATLHKHKQIAAQLIELFDAKFNPWIDPDLDRQQLVEQITMQLGEAINKISALDEDRMLRAYLKVISAMVRTNYYALADDPRPSGTPRMGRGALAFKINADRLDFIGGRQPPREIFVYSPQMEGVHVRFGKISRGGIRWSDRAEDYRTEILGLVGAQTVKNSIIVPVGAKGGFYSRTGDGRGSYESFISALLSLTDNYRAGELVRPDRVVAWDDDDPYLVVAADKGTAGFSDLANQLATAQGFWLGDAFASGGSHGYNHKQMGITAHGAWISVQRHFSEMGIDPATDEFTCVGIGDMSGDVFGNGMLLAPGLKLVAAFNHRHIFLDPNPDIEVARAERQRLFDRPRSNWSDYQPELISRGGGVHLRTDKTITVSDEVRAVLGLAPGTTELTPNQMIQAILRAPVDLMWNGGIGTWVKASYETHGQVADRGNDAVRVDANQVRAGCVAEGGNLGWTQAARVEYALAGGRINTDFIDNSAGVAISDHEVNIKILLDAQVDHGVLTVHERNDLLAGMGEEVARIVLAGNLAQNRALANSLYAAPDNAGVHEDLMTWLEQAGHLNRRIDGLPSTQELAGRAAAGGGLVGPELAVLLANVKILLAGELLKTDLPDDPYLADRLVKYFPTQLQQRFADVMPHHRLAREIITSVAVNRFVDSQGITAAHRLREETGANPANIVRGQLAARNLMDAGWLETMTNRAGSLPVGLRTRLRAQVKQVVEHATRWLLQEYRGELDIEAVVAELKPGTQAVLANLPDLLTETSRNRHLEQQQELLEGGVVPALAGRMAGWQVAHLALPIVKVSLAAGWDVATAARSYFTLSERLGIDRVLEAAQGLPRMGRWQIMARASVKDELFNVAALVTAAALEGEPGQDAEQLVAQWWAAHPEADRHHELLDDLTVGEADLARLSVAVSALRNLVMS